jgi:hypothetical protein
MNNRLEEVRFVKCLLIKRRKVITSMFDLQRNTTKENMFGGEKNMSWAFFSTFNNSI